MFFYKVEGHMPKLSSFGRGKNFRPKKSLTSLLHAALQLYLGRLTLRQCTWLAVIPLLVHAVQGVALGELSGVTFVSKTVTAHV